jgi:hypothetical protein
MRSEELDELKSALRIINLAFKNFASKKYLSEETRRRSIRNLLPLEYVPELNDALFKLEKDFQLTGFELDRSAFRTVIESIRFDIREAEQEAAKGKAA